MQHHLYRPVGGSRRQDLPDCMLIDLLACVVCRVEYTEDDPKPQVRQRNTGQICVGGLWPSPEASSCSDGAHHPLVTNVQLRHHQPAHMFAAGAEATVCLLSASVPPQLEEDCKVECLKEWHAYKVGAARVQTHTHTHTWCLMPGQLGHLQSLRHQGQHTQTAMVWPP